MPANVRTRMLNASECAMLSYALQTHMKELVRTRYMTADLVKLYEGLHERIGVKGRRLYRNLVTPEVE